MIYFLLARLSGQGQQAMRDNPEILNDVCREVSVPGTQLLARYAVLGQYDFVLMAEAKDPLSVARLSVELGARARIHIETLPAISIGLLAEPSEEGLLPMVNVIEDPTGE